MGWDLASFEACFRERYPELVQFLHALMGDRGAGEDAAQEAFARLWARGPSARPVADRWLFHVARNLGLDWLKTEQRRRERERLAAPELDEAPFADGDVRRVRALVAGLPPRDREVLLLREFTNLSYAEIAQVVDRSENAVKQDLHRARERLRREWHARYGGE